MTQSLEDSLVEFFKRTNVSCAIVKALSDSKGPIKFDQLLEAVGLLVADRIPDYALEGAVRASLKLLKASGWVTKSGAEFSLTDLGRHLAKRVTS